MGILLIEKISAIYTRIHGFKKNSSCTKRGLCKLVSVEVLIFYLGDSKLCFRSKLNILKENYCILSSKFANIDFQRHSFFVTKVAYFPFLASTLPDELYPYLQSSPLPLTTSTPEGVLVAPD